jgi:hypothetical protein
MNHTFFGGLAAACLTSALPLTALAQDFVAGAPINCTITRPRPVYSTQLRPQQVTVFRDVTETQLTQQNIVENVPITTCKNVTVDEGGYQMVWVSKPVTRQVAQTVVQQQVRSVSVPVQVRRRVPQTATQMVPVQTVQYVNETVPLQMTAMASTCSTCGGGSMGMPMQTLNAPILAPQMGYVPGSYQTQQYSAAAIPTMPAIEVPTYQNSAIPRRDLAPGRSGMTEETVRARSVPTPQDEEASQTRKTSMFQGVPSAASVWRRQEASYAR